MIKKNLSDKKILNWKTYNSAMSWLLGTLKHKKSHQDSAGGLAMAFMICGVRQSRISVMYEIKHPNHISWEESQSFTIK